MQCKRRWAARTIMLFSPLALRPDRRGRGVIQRNVHETPGRGSFGTQIFAACNPVHPKCPRGNTGSRGHTRTGTRQYTHRNAAKYVAPAAPFVKLNKVIRPHQPDEMHAGVHRLQRINRIRRCSRAQMRLKIADLHPRIMHHLARLPQPFRHWRRLSCLQRIAGADQPPYLIQPHALDRFMGDMDMAFMRRVKRPAQQAHDHALACNWKTLLHHVMARPSVCVLGRRKMKQLYQASSFFIRGRGFGPTINWQIAGVLGPKRMGKRQTCTGRRNKQSWSVARHAISKCGNMRFRNLWCSARFLEQGGRSQRALPTGSDRRERQSLQ